MYNENGNVVQISYANGNIVNNYTYDEWGNAPSQAEGIDNLFKYIKKLE